MIIYTRKNAMEKSLSNFDAWIKRIWHCNNLFTFIMLHWRQSFLLFNGNGSNAFHILQRDITEKAKRK